MRAIELLAPAKNLECGKAAVEHGADAVYIGAQRFGARAAAGNSVEDIAELCRYAHLFGARVYVTVNTIVYDDELATTRRLIAQLQAVGVDALLVQDMGVAGIVRETGMPLHASTQTDNRTAEKVRWLHEQGFSRVVLARELSLEEIAAIHKAMPDVELEVFVHGALCVSYSGVCYASQHCFNRSANRGACAQFCRLKFDLKDADGKLIAQQRHLLSLKDMCRIDRLEELLAAGACSLKIEGRLKDVAYVKNVVAAYSQRLNDIIAKHPQEYCRASFGNCTYSFAPNLNKTFNRGFTDYFLDAHRTADGRLSGRRDDIFSPDTPKAIGEYVGKVKELRGNSFNVAGTATFANGDGLCFFNDRKELEGFRVNRVEGNRLYPQKLPHGLRPGMGLYRNHDVAFEKLLSGKSAERKLQVRMQLSLSVGELVLRLSAPLGQVVCRAPYEQQEAKTPQRENIIRQLTKLGNTPFECVEVELLNGVDKCFVPSSLLASLRRDACDSWCRESASRCMVRGAKGEDCFVTEKSVGTADSAPLLSPHASRFSYLYNISNRQAAEFYRRQGVDEQEPALELQKSPLHEELLLMQCRHCLRYSLGACVKHGGQKPSWREPLTLELPDRRRFRLEFNCKECQMNVIGRVEKR